VCGSLNVLIERVAYRPLRNAPKLAPLITAVGFSFILQNVGLLWLGGSPAGVDDLINENKPVFHIFGVVVRRADVLAVAVTIPLVMATFVPDVSSDQFRFSFSIFVLSMVIVGGLGSIWGVLLGALLLSYINQYLIPDVLNSLPGDLGLSFSLTDIGLGIYGFLLVLVMILRPQGLLPERTRRLEFAEHIGVGETELEAPQA
jgi:branched-subunit amino acid ABC-type transport system permease component